MGRPGGPEFNNYTIQQVSNGEQDRRETQPRTARTKQRSELRLPVLRSHGLPVACCLSSLRSRGGCFGGVGLPVACCLVPNATIRKETQRFATIRNDSQRFAKIRNDSQRFAKIRKVWQSFAKGPKPVSRSLAISCIFAFVSFARIRCHSPHSRSLSCLSFPDGRNQAVPFATIRNH